MLSEFVGDFGMHGNWAHLGSILCPEARVEYSLVDGYVHRSVPLLHIEVDPGALALLGDQESPYLSG